MSGSMRSHGYGAPVRRSGMLADFVLALAVLAAVVVAFACGRQLALAESRPPSAGDAGPESNVKLPDESSRFWFHIDVKTSSGEVRIDPTGVQVKEK